MSTQDEINEAIVATWSGKIVPRSFDAGFAALSFVVSLIGAASTLELMNRRTSNKGPLQPVRYTRSPRFLKVY